MEGYQGISVRKARGNDFFTHYCSKNRVRSPSSLRVRQNCSHQDLRPSLRDGPCPNPYFSLYLSRLWLSVFMRDYMCEWVSMAVYLVFMKVCDLYCGGGTDTDKWEAAQIGHYIGIGSQTSIYIYMCVYICRLYTQIENMCDFVDGYYCRCIIVRNKWSTGSMGESEEELHCRVHWGWSLQGINWTAISVLYISVHYWH